MSRRAGYGYIDQTNVDTDAFADAPSPPGSPAPGEGSLGAGTSDPSGSAPLEDDQMSGSSVEEEGESDGEPFQLDSRDLDVFDLSHLDLDDGLGDYNEEEDEEDWDVDGEDWELANGDFTKQYNRVRQQQAATSGTAPLPARNLPKQHAAAAIARRSAKPNPLAGMGVTMNPKASGDKQDKDKSDRATQEQVLDSRTRLVLAALVNRGVIGKVDRCISTGKEANVYFAAPRLAVKIYRTSILIFRSRQNYIVGEQRFRGEYTSSRNPRKMIRVWAEKELRNLRRLVQGGVRAPKVLECKENVLVMEFLGKGEEASPRLKDVEIDPERLLGLYAELVIAVRRMYQHCHLVHADLSEYNILLHEDHLWIIDVSQSVEHDHPNAFDFLRSDLSNVEEFFSKRGVSTLGLRRSWEFVVTEFIGLTPAEEYAPADAPGGGGDAQLAEIVVEWAKEPSDKTDDAVFMSSYIPRSLAEVYDPERDVEVLNSGKGDDLIYAGVTGLKLSQPGRAAKSDAEKEEEVVEVKLSEQKVKEEQPEKAEPVGSAVQPEAEPAPARPTKAVRFEDEEEAEEEEAGDDSEEEGDDKRPRGFRHEDRDAKKERKKALKEENREKRKKKMPKAEKQRLMKKSQAH